MFTANSSMAKVLSVKYAAAVLCEKSKYAVNLGTQQDGKVPVPGFRKYWRQKPATLKSECHTITNKCPEVASIVQQVYKVLSDTENLARCTRAEVW
jgi:hypothetical protein